MIDEHNVDEDDIVIVIIEIESWYYDGLRVEDCRDLDIPILADNQKVDKEKLEKTAINKQYTLNKLLLEMVKYFDLQEARVNNSSFDFL